MQMIHIKVILGPVSASDRPLLLVAVRKRSVNIAQAQMHRCLMPRVHSLEEVIEKSLLKVHTVWGIKLGKMLQSMQLKPLLFGGDPHVALHISTEVERVPAPVPAAQDRNLNLREVSNTSLIPLIHHLPLLEGLAQELSSILLKLTVGQCFRSGNALTSDAADQTIIASTMLKPIHLDLPPLLNESADKSSVPCNIAVHIIRALKRTDCCQMRRFQRGGSPLGHSVVRDTQHANLSARIGLLRQKLYTIIDVLSFAGTPAVDHAFGTAGTARIDPHDDITVTDPFLWIDCFPIHVPV